MKSSQSKNFIVHPKERINEIQSASYRKERGIRLWQARKQVGMSATKFSSLIGISPSTYLSMEKGEVDFKCRPLELAAEISGVNRGWLFFGDGTMHSNSDHQ